MDFLVDFKNYFEGLTLGSTAFRLAFAAFCGAIMGMERRKANKPVGMRTYMLLAIGAATVSITSQYMWDFFAADRPDAQRLGAQVISGTGFLCASVIIGAKNNTISGITTAAEMWACACLGLAIGIGNYWVGFIGTLIVFFVMTFSRKLESTLLLKSRYIPLQITGESEDVFYEVAKTLKDMGVGIKKVVIENDSMPETDENEPLKTVYYGIEDGETVGYIMIKSKNIGRGDILKTVRRVSGVVDAWL